MIPNGLPPLEVPFHLQEPNSCKDCKHSYFRSDDTHHRYLRCSRHQWSQQCRYERHETGECGPAAKYWKDRCNV